jgi:flagellar biosynthesis anti-sigma factor FlgM
MISSIKGSALTQTYAKATNETKEIRQNAKLTSPKEGGQSKIESLKESIDSGEYKVDLSALASKMADELL